MKIRKILLLVLCFLTFLVIGYFYENKVNYVHFVDEEENMVGGKYLGEGQKLYSDIFSQHQPIAYILSTGVQKVTNPSSIFLLVKRHREFISAWSIIWATFLVWRYGYWVAPALFSYEVSKIFLLGNLFLAESLVVYPLLYLCGLALTGEKIRRLEFLFAGLTFGIIFFLLSPVWPLLAAIAITYLLKGRKIKRSEVITFSFGVLSVILLVSAFISWKDYIQVALIFNAKYFIPLSSEQLSLATIPESFFSFLTVFFGSPEKTPILLIIRGISILYILGSIILISKKLWRKALVAFLILGLANIRYSAPGLDYYRGFHLDPWFAVLQVATSYIYCLIFVKIKQTRWFLVVGVILISIPLYYAKDTLFLKRDVMKDYYINYSPFVDAGGVISILKKSNDTLFVVPDGMLVYWQANINKFSRYIYFYLYMNDVPYVFDDFKRRFAAKPPTFFFCRCQDNIVMREYLTGYLPVLRGGKSTDLYVLKERARLTSAEQKDYFSYYRFSF